MTRFNRSIALAGAICVLLALPALASDPGATKSVLTTADGSVYGINVSDASASLEDISVPDGWVGIATDDMILLRTLDNPIGAGEAVSFRIVTKNSQAPLGLVFRDKKTAFASKEGI